MSFFCSPSSFLAILVDIMQEFDTNLDNAYYFDLFEDYFVCYLEVMAVFTFFILNAKIVKYKTLLTSLTNAQRVLFPPGCGFGGLILE